MQVRLVDFIASGCVNMHNTELAGAGNFPERSLRLRNIFLNSRCRVTSEIQCKWTPRHKSCG